MLLNVKQVFATHCSHTLILQGCVSSTLCTIYSLVQRQKNDLAMERTPNSVLYEIQKKANSCISPGDLGCLPAKIESGFSRFTAEQWKNWTLYYSLFRLKDVLPRVHYECWLLFVKGCYLLCHRTISKILKNGII